MNHMDDVGFDNDGHKRALILFIQTLALYKSFTYFLTNHDDHLGEIYSTMLSELNCTFGVKFFTLSLL